MLGFFNVSDFLVHSHYPERFVICPAFVQWIRMYAVNNRQIVFILPPECFGKSPEPNSWRIGQSKPWGKTVFGCHFFLMINKTRIAKSTVVSGSISVTRDFVLRCYFSHHLVEMVNQNPASRHHATYKTCQSRFIPQMCSPVLHSAKSLQ